VGGGVMATLQRAVTPRHGGLQKDARDTYSVKHSSTPDTRRRHMVAVRTPATYLLVMPPP